MIVPIAVVACGVAIAVTSKDTGNTGSPLSAMAHAAIVHRAVAHDMSAPLSELGGTSVASTGLNAGDVPSGALAPDPDDVAEQDTVIPPPKIIVPRGGARAEQQSMGKRPPAVIVANFAGLGADFVGPQGNAVLRNPSDNSLAVGPNHVFQIVNSRTAIFSKDGKPLYGPVETSNVFQGFGGACETHNNGDAVVRYDQLADRWLIVMPIFSRLPRRSDEPAAPRAGEPAAVSQRGQPGQPGSAAELNQPPHAEPTQLPEQAGPRTRPTGPRPPADSGSYAMCYAVSSGPDPLGSYYRYEFVRPLFPDYPRPAIWPDGYYVPTSTGDAVIQKHACVADRVRMLKGEDATEQCMIVDDVNFLNNSDLDGKQLPPAGSPNIVLAAGGTQLRKVLEDDGIYAWKYYVNWEDPSKTKLVGPEKIQVAPYHYLCDGQLTNCVPQPGATRRLDAQGDKLMSRVVYRRIGKQESIVASHSINTSLGGGGVRWYEFRLDRNRDVKLYQQGTFAPDSNYRWLGSAAMDGKGNIGVGYSFGGPSIFAGQRFTGRTPNDPKGVMSLKEAVLATGEAAQENTLRWEDYSATAIDPTDDCTIWYVGDYLMKGSTRYSSRIGAFRLPGCGTKK
ncbi:MAG: hypothetical protein ABI035_00415 [Gemmatimonadaceae bacterium]